MQVCEVNPPLPQSAQVKNKFRSILNVFVKMKSLNKTILLGVALLGAALVAARADDTKALYEKECAKCHGSDGKGATKTGKNSAQRLPIQASSEMTDAGGNQGNQGRTQGKSGQDPDEAVA